MIESDRIISVLNLIEEDVISIMVTANSAGFSYNEVFQALEVIVKNARMALEEDPDPADDRFDNG